MVRAFGGATMARAAEEALVKIGAVLPESERERINRTEIHSPIWVIRDQDRASIDLIERAVESRDVVAFEYLDAPVKRVGAKNGITPQSHVLEAAFLPNVDDLIAAANSII